MSAETVRPRRVTTPDAIKLEKKSSKGSKSTPLKRFKATEPSKASKTNFTHKLYDKLYEETSQKSARQIDHEQLGNKINDLPTKFPEQIEQINAILYSLIIYHHYLENHSLTPYPYETIKKKRQVRFDLMKYPARLRLIINGFIELLSIH